MAFTSVSGIAFAAPTAASAISRRLVPLVLLASLAAAAGPTGIEIRVEGLRNAEGSVRLCLTRHPEHFPACNGDPAAIRHVVPASRAAIIRLSDVAPGVYALSVVHDENDNSRLDRFMGIPREGFGFSRNPRMRMGPPRFEEARFELSAETRRQVVRLNYLL
jgi:uncharacterized protein (DUF2141 family)